jgi:hypothetical protein
MLVEIFEKSTEKLPGAYLNCFRYTIVVTITTFVAGNKYPSQ